MISKGVPPSTSDPPLNLKPQADCVPSLKISTGTKKSTHSEFISSDLSLKAGNQLNRSSTTKTFTVPTNFHILPGDPFCLLHALFICCSPPDTEMLGTEQTACVTVSPCGRVARRILRRESINSEKTRIEISAETWTQTTGKSTDTNK